MAAAARTEQARVMPEASLSQRALAALDLALATPRRAALALALIALAFFLPGFFTLQPMDRDEPRFAQASKQMIETGDLVDIRFQGEARHKKPVGIYWLQAAVVAAAEKLGVPEARTTIWLYRLPSLAGAVLAVVLTFWGGATFLTRRMAFLSALLFASCVLIGVEARLAKTDAVIAATVIACMAVLARAWLGRTLTLLHQFIFWTAMSLGILVKGPITPMIVLFAIVTLWAVERRAGWLRNLRPLPGLIWCAALIAPWFILIIAKTGGAFFTEAIGNDMLGKVAAGQEAHGAPPGTYLAMFWATAWPLAPFAALAAPFAWAKRRDPKVLFLLAWIVPAWLLFEIVPTKLPHYVLPVYPAIAILCGLAIEAGMLHGRARWRSLVLYLIPLVPIGAGLVGAALWYMRGSGYGIVWFLLVAAVGGSLGFRARLALTAGEGSRAVVLAASCALFTLLNVFSFALTTSAVEFVTLSPRIAAARALAASEAKSCAALAPLTAGYREPSLVFLTGTDLVMADGAQAAAFLKAAPCRIAFVEAKEEAAFLGGLAGDGAIKLASRVAGINLNGGRRLDIGVYVRQGSAP